MRLDILDHAIDLLGFVDHDLTPFSKNGKASNFIIFYNTFLKNLEVVMNKILQGLIGISLGVVLVGCSGGSSVSKVQYTDVGVASDGTLNTILEETIHSYNIPAMAAMSVDQNSIVEVASVGVKNMGSDIVVTMDEKWGIGSITKSMTATLAAILIDKGFLSWESTLLEIFPEFEATMQPQYKDITLVELLSHSSGLPQDDDTLWEIFADESDSVMTQRYDLAEEVLAYDGSFEVGTFHYSNIGYVVAAAVLERVMEQSFEVLIQEYLFDAMDMNHSQVDIDALENQAWGHTKTDGVWIPKSPNHLDADNAAIVAPAGSRSFVSLEDMARYLQLHLVAMRDQNNPLMTQENFLRLHTKVVDVDEDLGYALGWMNEMDYGLQHTGSNGRWFALSFVNAQTGFAYFVVVNAYEAGIEDVVFGVLQLLIQRTTT
jgi:CubicO group peptidase (beta-lactamase class C family)